MRLLILGEPVGALSTLERPQYRGTYRDRPHYCEQFPEDHEVNQAFFWSTQRIDDEEYDIVHDLEKAMWLIGAYKENTGQEFDIVEVTKGEELPAVGTQFLGYDLSREFFNSLLWYGLEICYLNTGAWDQEREDLMRLIQPLVCLIEHHFKPMLNANGLFGQYVPAKNCLDCMAAIQTICPDWFESGENTFEVVGLHKVEK
jgi:hypothetical protein